MMIRLELQRIFKTPKNIFVLLAMILFSFTIMYQMDQNKVKYDELQTQEYYGADSIAGQEKRMLKIMEETPEVKEAIDYWTEEDRYSGLLSVKFSPRSNGNDILTNKERVDTELQRFQNILRSWGKYDTSYLQIARDEHSLKKEIMQREYLLDHKIKQYSSPYEINSINYLVHYFQSPNIFVILALLAFAAIDVIARDFDCDSYKMLYTAPISRKKIIFSKMAAIMIFSFIALLLAVGIPVITAYFMSGSGTLGYPQVLDDLSIITSISYVIKCGSALLTLLLFMISLITLISVILRSGTSTMMGIGAVFIALYCIGELKIAFPTILHYVPLFSIDVPVLLNLKGFSIALFCVISVVLALVGVIISGNIIQKADLFGGGE